MFDIELLGYETTDGEQVSLVLERPTPDAEDERLGADVHRERYSRLFLKNGDDEAVSAHRVRDADCNGGMYFLVDTLKPLAEAGECIESFEDALLFAIDHYGLTPGRLRNTEKRYFD